MLKDRRDTQTVRQTDRPRNGFVRENDKDPTQKNTNTNIKKKLQQIRRSHMSPQGFHPSADVLGHTPLLFAETPEGRATGGRYISLSLHVRGQQLLVRRVRRAAWR